MFTPLLGGTGGFAREMGRAKGIEELMHMFVQLSYLYNIGKFTEWYTCSIGRREFLHRICKDSRGVCEVFSV